MQATATPSRKPLPPQVASILASVTKETGILPETFIGAIWQQRIAYEARNLALVVIYVTTDLTLYRIGQIFEVHFSTVLYTVKNFTLRLPVDQHLAEKYTALLHGRAVLRPLGGKHTSAPEPIAEDASTTRSKAYVAGDLITPETHGHLHQLSRRAVIAKLRDAEEQLTYWSGAKARALTERDRDAAAARVTLWQGEVRAITARLAQLSAA